MTETSSLLRNTAATLFKTFQPPNSYPVTATAAAAAASPLPNGTISDSNAQDEEEYTIKCICVYTDDDGNTVYCPKCDTWQHIECYYHGKRVPEEHFCSDCLPRDLNGQKATERQRRAREHLEGGDRKVKRPQKTSRKKHKDSLTNEQTNGWNGYDRHESIPNSKDQPPPAKKPKTNHRTSGSVVSLNGESRKRAYSNVQSYPSPSKSPQDLYRMPLIPQYTAEFLELYERDGGVTDCHNNEYTIPASNFLSEKKTDPAMIVKFPDQQPSAASPFAYTSEDLNKKVWPTAKLRTATWDTPIGVKYPTWRYLVLDSEVQKDEIMGEIRGEVGMLDEYCSQQSNQNRWPELGHPDPFVFFHPHMNIYIDSRKKGTQYRYLRRSCRPNVTLKTFITDDGEMRHCFVANQGIKAGSELTAAWYLDPQMFNMAANREDSEQLENRQCEWVSRVLANFGDCACDKTQCPWAHLDRRTPLSAESSIKPSVGRKRKGKSKQAISPLSTGQATNSRAGSEAFKGQDDDEQYDRRSTSESSRSGVRSRDLTPVNVAVLDADPVLGDGLTARELRKIEMAEKAFERKEGATEKKKKKRTSGGSTLNTPNVGSSKQLGHSPGPADFKRLSGSSPPPRAVVKDMNSRSALMSQTPKHARPVYVSVSVQTDPEDHDIQQPAMKRRKFSTPTQRLLKKVWQDRMTYEQQGHSSSPSLSPKTYLPSAGLSIDVEMKDAGASAMSPSSSTSNKSSALSPTSVRDSDVAMASVPLTLPSQVAHSHTHFKSPSGPKLHLHTLPPVPTFPNGVAGVTTPGSANTTPALTTPSTVQSPHLLSAGSPSYQSLNASIACPSPAKKKLSLGDYMSRRNMSATTPVAEKSQAQANVGMMDGVKDSDSDRKASNAGSEVGGESINLQPVIDEAARRGVEANAVEDTPIKDEEEPDYSPPPGASPAPEDGSKDKDTALTANHSAAPGGPHPDVANVFAQLAQYSDRARSQSAGSA